MTYKIDKFFTFYNFNGLKHGAIPFSEINFYHLTFVLSGKVTYKVNDYINKQKTLLAKDMLTSNELSLQDIAYSLGYENYGYFNKVFKKHFGISPIKMKSELKKN